MPFVKLVARGTTKPWYPESIPNLEKHLYALLRPLPKLDASRIRGIAKNLAYTLQYLEFLLVLQEEVSMSEVITMQNKKSFIVNACSVIESIFYYLLHQKNEYKSEPWQSIHKEKGDIFKHQGKNYRVEVETFIESEAPSEKPMTFDAMCKKIESKKMLSSYGLSQEFYDKLPTLRVLRNRVHIHGIEDSADTDFLKIVTSHVIMSRQVLFELLTSKLFKSPDSLDFAFLNPMITALH
jgi:hypothetical protein